MKRRSFIQSLMAIPVIAAASKIVGASPRTDTPKSRAAPRRENLENQYQYFIAAAGIYKGQMVTKTLNAPTIVPLTDERYKFHGLFVGVAMNDAMKGDKVKVMTKGCAPVVFK